MKCDGKADCVDQTDEIKATCFDVECPGTKYKCEYGACTVRNAQCNGVIDCFDGSDEAPSVCHNAAPRRPPPPQPLPTPRPPSAAPYVVNMTSVLTLATLFDLGVAAFYQLIQVLGTGQFLG